MPLAVTYKPLKALIPYARNSRTHPAIQVAKLQGSLAEYGWTRPIAIADGVIVFGHGIVQAAMQMAEHGVAIPGNPDPWQAPTVDLSHLSDAQRKAYIIADNKLSLEAGWDEELLRLEFGDLMQVDFDMTLTGFDLPEIDALLNGWSPDIDKIDKVDPSDDGLRALYRINCRREDAGRLRTAIEGAVLAAGIPDVEINP